MINLRRLFTFLLRLLRFVVLAAVVLCILSIATETLTHLNELESAWRDWGFWGSIALNLIPVVATSALALWLAARFVNAVYALGSARAGLGFLLRSRFGLPGFGPWMLIEKGNISRNADGVLNRIGGPGHLVIYNDSAVVLECGGRFTRVEGPGFSKLEAFEKVYDIVDLRPKRWIYTVNAMTKDGVPISWDAEIRYQIEDGGQQPSKETPYPFSKSAVFKAATSRWVFVGRSTKLDWEGLVVISGAEGNLRRILATWRLDELVYKKEEVQKELARALGPAANEVGAKILAVELDNLQVDEEIRQQWVTLWQANWQRWSTEQLAHGEASRIYQYEQAKAEAQMSLMASIARAFEGLMSQDRVTPQIVLMRLFSVLDRANFASSSRIFFPNEALETLESMKRLLDSGP